MISGIKHVNAPPAQVMAKLRALLAAAGWEIIESGDDFVSFRHGTWLTLAASMLPKRGTVRLTGLGDSTRIWYDIKAPALLVAWMTTLAVLLFWTVLVPVLVHSALVLHPRRLIENLLAGV